MIACPPPTFKPSVIVSGRHFGPNDQGPVAFAPVLKLGPVVDLSKTVGFMNWFDELDFVNQRGALKSYHPGGGPTFSVEKYRKLKDLYVELVTTAPDTRRSGIFFHWYSPASKIPKGDSAIAHGEYYQWL